MGRGGIRPRFSISTLVTCTVLVGCMGVVGLAGCAGSGDYVDAGSVGRSAAGTRTTGVGARMRVPVPAASEVIVPRLDPPAGSGKIAAEEGAGRDDGSGTARLEMRRITPFLRGVSGIVASPADPNLFWISSGAARGPEVFAVDREGRISGSVDGYRIQDVGNAGWADITTVPGDSGRLLLAVSDTANPGRLREDVFVFGFAEPAVESEVGSLNNAATGREAARGSEKVPNAFRMAVSLPARRFHSEAFYCDETGPAFFSRTKRMVVLYGKSGELRPSEFAELTPLGALKVDENPVGADRSDDGVLLLTHRGLWLFEPPVSSRILGPNIFRGIMYRLSLPDYSWSGVCFHGENAVLVDADGRYAVVSLESLRQHPVMRE